MKTAFQWVKLVLTKLWRTVVCTFCKRHIYIEDIDNDQVQEIILDINGKHDVEEGTAHVENQELDVNINNNK